MRTHIYLQNGKVVRKRAPVRMIRVAPVGISRWKRYSWGSRGLCGEREKEMGPGAGTQCDAGRWSEGKSGRGKRMKTKKERRARGESASLRTGQE